MPILPAHIMWLVNRLGIHRATSWREGNQGTGSFVVQEMTFGAAYNKWRVNNKKQSNKMFRKANLIRESNIQIYTLNIAEFSTKAYTKVSMYE